MNIENCKIYNIENIKNKLECKICEDGYELNELRCI